MGVFDQLFSSASTFSIDELYGTLYIEMSGRALPYRKPNFTGRMRMEKTYYPGNPIATAQVFGAEDQPSKFSGMWKDRFIGTDPEVLGDVVEIVTNPHIPSPQTGLVVSNGVVVRDAMSACMAIDEIRQRGQLLQVTWDSIVRRGYLVEFTFSPLRHQDIEWEMTFDWISHGQTEAPVLPGIQVPDIAGIASEFFTALSIMENLAAAPFQVVSAVVGAVTTAFQAMVGAVTSIANVAQQATQQVLSQADAAKKTIASLKTVITSSDAVFTSIQNLPAAALRTSDSIADVTQEQSLQAAYWGRNMCAQVRNMKYLAAVRINELASTTINQPIKRMFVARAGQDLRDVSVQFFGTQDEWKQIAAFNGLSSSALTAGQLILVPNLATSSQGTGGTNATIAGPQS